MSKMSTSTNVILVMALLLLWTAVPFSSSFTPPSNRLHSASSSSRIIVSSADLDDGVSDTRQRGIIRFTIASVLAIVPFVSWDAHNPAIVLPPSAFAIQEKNEVLCNTGFFTNVGAWYCTDIGNIGDEGKPKPISGEAEASVDSLMSKFDIDGGDFSDNIREKNNNNNKQVDMKKLVNDDDDDKTTKSSI